MLASMQPTACYRLMTATSIRDVIEIGVYTFAAAAQVAFDLASDTLYDSNRHLWLERVTFPKSGVRVEIVQSRGNG